MLQMMLKVTPKHSNGAQDGRAGHIDQGAEAFPPIEIEDFLELIE